MNIEVLQIAYVILKNSVPTESPIVFHNGSNYDYHFIIIELAEDVQGQFTEKYWKNVTFSVPIEKEVIWISKNGEEITKNIS